MNEPIKILALELENVKRIKALHMQPAQRGLTVIGGGNRAGKTSALDALTWALGGDRKRPTNPQREGAMNPPSLDVTLSNGIRVQRNGKASTLKVTDPRGQKAGQALIDSFVSEFAISLPSFLNATGKEKAKQLLKILGIGDELARLELEEQRLYNERHAIGQIADSKAKHAAELPEFSDAPAEPVSISELIQQQQAILAENGRKHRLRNDCQQLILMEADLARTVARLTQQLAEAQDALLRTRDDLDTARKTVAELQDESTAEIEASIANIEAINSQVAANMAKAQATEEAEQYRAQYQSKDAAIDAIRAQRMALLDGSKLPLRGLSIEAGEIIYNGQRWDGMSGAEQLQVAVAIVRQDKPTCGFVFMDKLEQFDLDTLSEFAAWAEAQDLQIIGTRVSKGDECSIVIEDGLPVGETYADVVTGVSAAVNGAGEDF